MIGTCWPNTCSASELTIVHNTCKWWFDLKKKKKQHVNRKGSVDITKPACHVCLYGSMYACMSVCKLFHFSVFLWVMIVIAKPNKKFFVAPFLGCCFSEVTCFDLQAKVNLYNLSFDSRISWVFWLENNTFNETTKAVISVNRRTSPY